jgi:ABC-2 type transport system permease protein
MRKVLVIAVREYLAAVRTKSFLISLIILPVMVGGSIVVQLLVKDQVDVRDKRFAIVDRTPRGELFAQLAEAVERRNQQAIFDPQTHKQIQPAFTFERVDPRAGTSEAIQQQRYELSERVRHGDLFGFLEIGAEVLQPGPGNAALSTLAAAPPADPEALREMLANVPAGIVSGRTVRYQSNSPTYDAFPRWVERVLNEEIQKRRCADAGLPREKLQDLLQPVPLLPKGLSKRNHATGEIEDGAAENRLVSFLAPTVLMLLMFMMVVVGATPLMQGVVEEKMQRIAEVLLGSVQPFGLMLGKLIGTVGVSLTLAGVYLGAGYWAAHRYGFADYLSAEVLVWFVIFQMLAVLMYGSLFIAVGAACTDLRETQSMLWPVMLLATLPMFVLGQVIREPSSPFVTVVSLIPFATPTLMIARQAIPPGVPLWQPLLGVVLVLVTTLACVWAAGRIFRVGILMQGKGAKPGDLVKWVLRG